jgi:hypothetical protein
MRKQGSGHVESRHPQLGHHVDQSHHQLVSDDDGPAMMALRISLVRTCITGTCWAMGVVMELLWCLCSLFIFIVRHKDRLLECHWEFKRTRIIAFSFSPLLDLPLHPEAKPE